jgi:hypothetical protein
MRGKPNQRTANAVPFDSRPTTNLAFVISARVAAIHVFTFQWVAKA